METFIEPIELVENPNFQEQRSRSLVTLRDETIDLPILDLINKISMLNCCFTIQSCFGHFLYKGLDNPHNVAPL